MQEIFKDIPGYEGAYQVSSLGRVNSLPKIKATRKKGSTYLTKERILNPTIGTCGYFKVPLYNGKSKTFRVHQLVAMAFLGHIPNNYKLVVDHRDDDKLNNNLDNLRVISQRKNTIQKNIKTTSIYTGVCWSKSNKKWKATICINGKIKYLGYFTNELDASNTYNEELKNIL